MTGVVLLCESLVPEELVKSLMSLEGFDVTMHEKCPFDDGKCGCCSFAAAPHMYVGRATVRKDDNCATVTFVNERVTIRVGNQTVHVGAHDVTAHLERMMMA